MPLHLVPRSLLYIECVAQLGSIQSASRHLGIAASAIYRQIKAMEESAGTPLFERSAGGMQTTAAGKLFVRQTERWRDDSARLWSGIQELQGLDFGHFKLGAMDSMVNGFIPEFLTSLAADFPHVQTEVEVFSPDQAVESILAGTCDLALAFNVRPNRELHVLWSAELPLGCVAAPDHPVAAMDSISLSACARFPIVFQNRSLAVRRYLEKHHKWLFQDEPQTIITNSLQLLKQMAVAGKHVALTSEFDTASEILSGSIVFVPVSDKDALPQTVSVITHARRQAANISKKISARLCADVEDYLNRVRAGASMTPQRAAV